MMTYPMAFIEKPGKVEFREMPYRPPNPGEVQVKVRSAAICGSDLHLFRGRHPSATLPSAVGHELSGVVAGCGRDAVRFREGDRVTVEPIISCGQCYYCKRGAYHLCTQVSFQYRKGQGAFAEYFYAPEERVYALPGAVSFEEGALIEPTSVALHAVKLSGIGIGQSSAVIGAGAIGLLVTMHLNNLTGVKPAVLDVNEFRCRKAVDLGAEDTTPWNKDDFQKNLQDLTAGLGVNVAFEAVGSEATLVQALTLVRKGGKVVLLGIFEHPTTKLPANIFVQKEISLVGSQGYSWDFEDSIQLIEGKRIRIGELITRRMPLSQLQEAFDLLTQPNHNQIKIIINIDHD